MSAAVAITRTEHSPAELRALATRSDDAAQARRLLAIVMVQAGTSRFDAARQAGIRSANAARLGASLQRDRRCWPGVA